MLIVFLRGRRLLRSLQTELVLNTHTIVADIRQDVLKLREDGDSQNRVVSDTRALWRHRIFTDYRLDSKQVSNFKHRRIQPLMFA